MLVLAIALAAATPDPGPAHIPEPDTVSPGFAGFLTVFLLAAATIVLVRSMVKHLRKVRYSPDPSLESPATPASGRDNPPADS